MLARALALALGAALLITQIIATCTHPDESISSILAADPAYRVTMSACILLQVCAWGLCVLQAADDRPSLAGLAALTALAAMAVGWIGLSSILRGPTHDAFTAVFTGSFLAFLVLLLWLLRWPSGAQWAMLAFFAILCACEAAFAVLYSQGQPFHVAQHIGLITYGATFSVFFALPHRWAHATAPAPLAHIYAQLPLYTI